MAKLNKRHQWKHRAINEVLINIDSKTIPHLEFFINEIGHKVDYSRVEDNMRLIIVPRDNKLNFRKSAMIVLQSSIYSTIMVIHK